MYYIGIDPSSNTGVVVLDDNMNVVLEKVINSKKDNKIEKAIEISEKIINELYVFHKHYDVKHCIEGFSYGSKGKSVDFQYGLGYLIRYFLYSRGEEYADVAPSQLKKFATGKGNSAKDVVMREVYKKWGYENNDNNIVDAYVLARMAKE